MSRMRHPFFQFCVVLLAAWVPGVRAGDPAGPSREEVAKAVRELGSEDLAERGAAYQKILDWGARDPKGILPLLPAEDPDLEIQSSCERLRRAVPLEPAKRKALKEAGDDADLQKVIHALFDGDPFGKEIQAIFDHDFRESQRPRIARILMHWLEAPETGPGVEMRSNAVWALGQMGGKSVAPAIAKLLENGDAKMRIAAAGALGQMGEKSAAPAIAKLLEDGDALVRSAAVGVLSAGFHKFV